jgi:hypothetical protein
VAADRLKLPTENFADPKAPGSAGKVESRAVIAHGDNQLLALRPCQNHYLCARCVLLGI